MALDHGQGDADDEREVVAYTPGGSICGESSRMEMIRHPQSNIYRMWEDFVDRRMRSGLQWQAIL